MTKTLGTQAIGAAGQLLVQYRLLKHGIDSARLTTDSGIDLVMYVPGTHEAHTVQVKATSTHFPYGKDSAPQLWWPFPVACKAQWLAAVDLMRDLVWLLPIDVALQVARGNSKGTTTLMWYIGEKPTRATIPAEADLDQYMLDNMIPGIIAEAQSDETEGR